MKASELRIGNYVYRQSAKLIIDKSSVYQIENVNIQSALKYEPIPLTEEWFDKFGFNQMGMWKILKDVEFSIIKGYGLALKSIDGYRRLNQNSIKYVHQLQNLFFALTGEELAVNN